MSRNNYRSLGQYCDNNALCGGYDYGNIQSYEFDKCNTIKENSDIKSIVTNIPKNISKNIPKNISLLTKIPRKEQFRHGI